MPMFSVQRDMHPPTGVELCLEACFFNLHEKSLLVATSRELHVYRLSAATQVSGECFAWSRGPPFADRAVIARPPHKGLAQGTVAAGGLL